MANPHTYYQPTEEEQQLIVAGWITAESLDKDYQEYLKKADWESLMTYEQWLTCKREWDALDAQYEAEIAPFDHQNAPPLTPAKEKRQCDLLNQMNWLEIALGY